MGRPLDSIICIYYVFCIAHSFKAYVTITEVYVNLFCNILIPERAQYNHNTYLSDPQ